LEDSDADERKKHHGRLFSEVKRKGFYSKGKQGAKGRRKGKDLAVKISALDTVIGTLQNGMTREDQQVKQKPKDVWLSMAVPRSRQKRTQTKCRKGNGKVYFGREQSR